MEQEGLELFDKNGLRKAFDALDQAVIDEVQSKVFEWYFASLMLQWTKGKLIAEYRNRGSSDVPISFYELEKLTGRGHTHCKRWHTLYSEHPDEETFRNWAHDVANIRMIKFGEAIQGRSDGKEDELPEPEDRGRDLLKCLWKHYSGLDPVWVQGCKGCLKMDICQEIVDIIEERVAV